MWRSHLSEVLKEVKPMEFCARVKQVLCTKIREMAAYSWLFVRNSGKDFTRGRKLNFETTLQCLITMESGSVQKELLSLFQYDPHTPTASALIQQRAKILPEALDFLFHEFNDAFPSDRTYRGYRLLACDGTDVNIAHNPADTENYFQSKPGEKGFNQLHLNAMYDLCSRRYTDAIIQPGRYRNEYRAMADMVDRSKTEQKTIFLADRGYEAYNIFAHVEQRNMYYLIRVRDSERASMVSSFPLPQQEEFDQKVHLILTRKQTKAVKASGEPYKFLPSSSTFDYLDLHSNLYYPISFRVVRFLITSDSFECVITNLPPDEFPPDELNKLYAMRWGIETAFRELKYAIGLTCFNAKKVAHIHQEIFARLLLYNFCEIITTHGVITQKDTKHTYQANFTLAIHVCRFFLRSPSDRAPPDVEALIRKYLLPIRLGRSDPRKVKPKSFASFLYRVA